MLNSTIESKIYRKKGNLMKKIIFYTYESKHLNTLRIYNGYCESLAAINNNIELIYTTQMCLLSTKLFTQGYEVYIKNYNEDMYEVKLGLNKRTDREIKMAHNIFKLWKSGEFEL